MDESGTTSRHNGLHHHLTLEKVRRPFLAGPDSHVGLVALHFGRHPVLAQVPDCG